MRKRSIARLKRMGIKIRKSEPWKRWFRNPNVRREMRLVMIDRLRAETKAREVNQLADKIGIGKTRRKKV